MASNTRQTPRQGEKLLEELGVDEGVRSRATPGIKVEAHQVATDKPLEERCFTQFRAQAARANARLV